MQGDIEAQVIWENFGSGLNRKLNTQGKKEVFLQEEMNSKQVVEEFVQDRVQVPERSFPLQAPMMASSAGIVQPPNSGAQAGLKSSESKQKENSIETNQYGVLGR